jgi:hypothetical protein
LLASRLWWKKHFYYHKWKKPRNSWSALSSCDCSWPTQRGNPKETFCQHSLQGKILQLSALVNCSAHAHITYIIVVQKITRWCQPITSFATFERAWYRPIHTGIVAKVGKQPKMRSYSGSAPQAIYYTKRPSKLTEPIQVLVKANIFSQQPTFMSELNKIRKNIL